MILFQLVMRPLSSRLNEHCIYVSGYTYTTIGKRTDHSVHHSINDAFCHELTMAVVKVPMYS
jgi:hypothetical protein